MTEQNLAVALSPKEHSIRENTTLFVVMTAAVLIGVVLSASREIGV